MWYCLFLTILQNEIQDVFLSFELNTFGSEKLRKRDKSEEIVTMTILSVAYKPLNNFFKNYCVA